MKKQKFPINLFLPYLGFYSAQAIFGTYLNLYLNDVGFSKTQMVYFIVNTACLNCATAMGICK